MAGGEYRHAGRRLGLRLPMSKRDTEPARLPALAATVLLAAGAGL